MTRFALLASMLTLTTLAPCALADANATSSAGAPALQSSQLEKIRRGVATVVVAGHERALALVLPSDGRLVTSLSALGGAKAPRVRFFGGPEVTTHVARTDDTWDLALLVPTSKKWTDGVLAATDAPGSSELHAFELHPHGGVMAGVVPFVGSATATSRGGKKLSGAYRVALEHRPTYGAPLIDGKGAVAGLIVRACEDESAPRAATSKKKRREPKPERCRATPVVAPVSAIRAFVMSTPANATIPRPWLGLAGLPEQGAQQRGVRVVAVAPNSPAAKAGVRPGPGATGDMVVAVDTTETRNPEVLAEAIGSHAVGDRVSLHILRQGKPKTLSVRLESSP